MLKCPYCIFSKATCFWMMCETRDFPSPGKLYILSETALHGYVRPKSSNLEVYNIQPWISMISSLHLAIRYPLQNSLRNQGCSAIRHRSPGHHDFSSHISDGCGHAKELWEPPAGTTDFPSHGDSSKGPWDVTCFLIFWIGFAKWLTPIDHSEPISARFFTLPSIPPDWH